MVVVINGTNGAGQAAVASAVSAILPDSVAIAAENLYGDGVLAELNAARAKGALVFVVSVVCEEPEHLKDFAARIQDFCLSFYLNISAKGLRARLPEAEANEAVEIARRQSAFIGSEFLGRIVETEGVPAERVARSLVRLIDQELGC